MECVSNGVAEPNIALCQLSAERDQAANCWNIHWRVENLGREGLTIDVLRLPHGQFKSAEKQFSPPLELSPGDCCRFETLVHCQEPAGLVTENAFVIFHCRWHGQEWRIFVRLRVMVASSGDPQTTTELITTQKVGFSGLSE